METLILVLIVAVFMVGLAISSQLKSTDKNLSNILGMMSSDGAGNVYKSYSRDTVDSLNRN